MSRLKVLLALFAVGLLGTAAMFVWGDGAYYWSETFRGDPTGYAVAPRLAAQRAAAATKPAAPAVMSTTLLRELPRQALLIAAAHDVGLPAVDRSVDFTGATPEAPLACAVAYEFGDPGAKVTLRDAKGAAVDTLDLAVPALHENYLDYAKLAAAVEPWCEATLAPLLAKAAGRPEAAAAAVATAADEAGAVPPQVESLLLQVDPQRAFLAARGLHAAVAASGESPERLAALARAYAQLGESTRFLYSAHGPAFFARALLYAERLARKHPELPLAHAARGYAYTLFGQADEGRRAFARARELAGAGGAAALPAWAQTAEDLSHFRTRALFDRIRGSADSASPLASYFTLLSVEHSGMQTLVINTARLALEYNPGALRVIHVMTDNSGVSLQHDSTDRARVVQFELLAELPGLPGVPESLGEAASDAAGKRFSADAFGALTDAMDAEPAAPGQLLPWGTYASISRDALFVTGFRRLYFTRQMLGTDVTNRLNAWWPLLEDHRFASVVAGFDRTGKLGGGEEAVDAIARISLDDFYQRMPWLPHTAKRLNPQPGGRPWLENYEYAADNTAYELANQLWTYRSKEADAIALLGAIKGEVAKDLEVICPGHPSAIAELIVNRWPETRARAADIERDLGNHPQVAFALARAYRSEKRYADAARLIEEVIAISPDPAAYEELAEMYKEQGDDERWLATYEKYLAESEDFGLDHAKKNEQIAFALMGMGKHEKALKYASGAADSGASWGLRAYAACLTELGLYDEAERVERANQDRYPMTFAWYRWCQTTGRGDLAAARAMSEAHVAADEARVEFGNTTDRAIYFLLDGQADRARTLLEADFKHRGDVYPALQLTLLDLEQGTAGEDTEMRLEYVRFGADALPPELARMMGVVTPPANALREKVYGAALEAFKDCLTTPGTVPPPDDERARTILAATGSAYRGNACYFLGRLCELRGNNAEALAWYRTAMETEEWTFTSRPQAAAAMRRLGEEYYR